MNSDSGRKFAIYPSKKPSKAEFNSSILKHLDLTSNFSDTSSLCIFGKKKKNGWWRYPDTTAGRKIWSSWKEEEQNKRNNNTCG